MLGLIFDVPSYDLKNYFGLDSYLELPLLDKKLGQYFYNEFISAGANVIKTVSFEEINNSLDAISDDSCLCVFSDCFFEFDTEELSKAIEYLNDFYIKNSEGITSGFYCRKQTLYSVISECDSFDDLYLKTIDNLFDFPAIGCVENLCKINMCSEYISFIQNLLRQGDSKRIPEVAQGIFTPSNIPYGDYIIIPPVYFGENVQIEKKCVIGPGAVIQNNVLIASGTTVKNSVIFDNTYISNNCFVDGTLCCNNSSIRRNSATFNGSVIGNSVIVGESVALENNSRIPVSSRVENIDLSSVHCNAGQSEHYTQFYGYNPNKAALLGSCLGNILNKPSVAVVSDGELNSLSVKLSLLGGLVSTGVRCFDFGNSFMSSIYYFVEFCELDYGFFISGNESGTVITVTDKYAKGLNSLQMGELSFMLNQGSVKYCTKDECTKIRVISSLGRMYIQHLIKNLSGTLNFNPIIECENIIIRGVIKTAFSKLHINESEKNRIIFKINEQGTNLTVVYKEKTYSMSTLERIVSYFIYLDNEAQVFDLNKNIDAVQLCFKLLEVLYKYSLTIDDAEKMLPRVYIAENVTERNKELSAIASHISEYTDLSYSNGCLWAGDEDVKIQILETDNKKGYKVSVNASSFEFANELAVDIVQMIKEDNNN